MEGLVRELCARSPWVTTGTGMSELTGFELGHWLAAMRLDVQIQCALLRKWSWNLGAITWKGVHDRFPISRFSPAGFTCLYYIPEIIIAGG